MVLFNKYLGQKYLALPYFFFKVCLENNEFVHDFTNGGLPKLLETISQNKTAKQNSELKSGKEGAFETCQIS